MRSDARSEGVHRSQAGPCSSPTERASSPEALDSQTCALLLAQSHTLTNLS
jgi:hypothetical protein